MTVPSPVRKTSADPGRFSPSCAFQRRRSPTKTRTCDGKPRDLQRQTPGPATARLGNLSILVLGVFMTGTCIIAVRVVLRWTRQFDVEEYSNPEDFPVNFAKKMVRIAIITIILLWVTALANDRDLMAVTQLLLIGASVQMLVSALRERPAPGLRQ